MGARSLVYSARLIAVGVRGNLYSRDSHCSIHRQNLHVAAETTSAYMFCRIFAVLLSSRHKLACSVRKPCTLSASASSAASCRNSAACVLAFHQLVDHASIRERRRCRGYAAGGTAAPPCPAPVGQAQRPCCACAAHRRSVRLLQLSIAGAARKSF